VIDDETATAMERLRRLRTDGPSQWDNFARRAAIGDRGSRAEQAREAFRAQAVAKRRERRQDRLEDFVLVRRQAQEIAVVVFSFDFGTGAPFKTALPKLKSLIGEACDQLAETSRGSVRWSLAA
jgi:hypothetical protein